ncbi:hypothetical protein [Kingella oralis]|uniref:hypothetical protein n=1 Tax=Kingella oralis TaxID=505 RepID=UPI0034E4CE63
MQPIDYDRIDCGPSGSLKIRLGVFRLPLFNANAMRATRQTHRNPCPIARQPENPRSGNPHPNAFSGCLYAMISLLPSHPLHHV